MITILKKLIQDFWMSRWKFVLSVLAASISIWGIVTVCFAFLMSERDFETNFLGASPSDFSIRISGFNNSMLDVFSNHPEVLTWERREVIQGEVENAQGIWMPVLLFGLESLENQKLEKIKFKSSEIPLESKLLLEQNTRGFFPDNLKSIQLRFGENRVKVESSFGGWVHDPLHAPAQMEQLIYAYASLDVLDTHLNPRQRRFIFKLKGENPDKERIAQLTSELENDLLAHGAEFVRVQIPEPGEHIHQPIIDGVAFLQIGFGGILLVLGITLFALILLTWLVHQIPQIGIVKSLGGKSEEIFGSYGLLILLLAGLGLLIGFPCGILTASGFNGFVAMIQNFEKVETSFPITYYLGIAFMAIAPTVLVGLIPIYQVTLNPVRQALSSTFERAPKGIVKLISQSGLSSSLKYSFGNNFRNGYRTYLLVVLMSMGFSLYFTGTILSDSFKGDLNAYFSGTPYQITVQLRGNLDSVPGFFNEIPEIKSYVPWKQLGISYQVDDRIRQASLKIFPKNFQLNESRFLVGEENRNCYDCIFVHPQLLLEEFKNTKAGDLITLYLPEGEVKELRFGGVMREVFPGNKDLLYWFTDKKISDFNLIDVELKDPVQVQQALKTLEASFVKNEFDFSKLRDSETGFVTLENHFQPTYLIVQGMGIFTLILSFFGTLLVVTLTLTERAGEIGIIKALGGSSWKISNLLGLEFLFLSILSVGFSIPVSQVFSKALCATYGEMIRGFALQRAVHLPKLTLLVIALLSILSFLVVYYSRIKIKKTSNELINSGF
ncbi:MAG: ABC transporter permease [Flavobacteriales bacterium]|nr:ABC transporter permease [Flavobacteriales bacterium]